MIPANRDAKRWVSVRLLGMGASDPTPVPAVHRPPCFAAKSNIQASAVLFLYINIQARAGRVKVLRNPGGGAAPVVGRPTRPPR